MTDNEKLDILTRMIEALKETNTEPMSPVERRLIEIVGALVEIQIREEARRR